jgi:predicted secreted protein
MRPLRTLFCAVAVAGLAALPALAGEPAPDRSALTYDENVTINMACFAKHAKGEAFNACVSEQIALLRQHPTPDRSALSHGRVEAIERNCKYLRRVSIADYNDCWRNEMDRLAAK